MPQGMVLGLIGANGAGETTSIRAALSLVKLTEGRVLLSARTRKPSLQQSS